MWFCVFTHFYLCFELKCFTNEHQKVNSSFFSSFFLPFSSLFHCRQMDDAADPSLRRRGVTDDRGFGTAGGRAKERGDDGETRHC